MSVVLFRTLLALLVVALVVVYLAGPNEPLPTPPWITPTTHG